MKIIDLQKGLTFHRTAKDSVFLQDLKRVLSYINVPLVDPCCTTDQTTFSVRYNTAGDNTLEFSANGTTWAPITIDLTTADLVATTVSTNTINESTANAGVTVDGVKMENGGISDSGETMFASFYPTVAAQSLSGAGAVNVTSFLTKYTSTGAAEALTIAAGTQIGQRKKIVHIVDGGSGVLTGTFVGGTTITFTTVAEFADLMWTGAAWAVLELGNTATPATIPALA